MLLFLLSISLLLHLISAEGLTGLADREGNRVWTDEGSWARYDLTVFEAKRATSTWYVLGHRAQNNYDDLSTPLYAFKENMANLLAKPSGFSFVWDDRGSTAFDDGSAWRAQCSSGYVAVGDFFAGVNRRTEAPSEMVEKIRCVHRNLTEACAGWGNKVWDTDGMWGDVYKASIWQPVPIVRSGYSSFFYVSTDINKPPINVQPLCLKLSEIKFM